MPSSVSPEEKGKSGLASCAHNLVGKRGVCSVPNLLLLLSLLSAQAQRGLPLAAAAAAVGRERGGKGPCGDAPTRQKAFSWLMGTLRMSFSLKMMDKHIAPMFTDREKLRQIHHHLCHSSLSSLQASSSFEIWMEGLTPFSHNDLHFYVPPPPSSLLTA